jgi:hypothetical protein
MLFLYSSDGSEVYLGRVRLVAEYGNDARFVMRIRRLTDQYRVQEEVK